MRSMRQSTRVIAFASVLLGGAALRAQAPTPTQKPAPDVLLLSDGEKIIGHMESGTDKAVKFKSDVLGELTIDWSKVQELHSSQKFAAIPKGAIMRLKIDTADVKEGEIAIENQKVTIASGPASASTDQAAPLSTYSDLVSESDYNKAFVPRNFFRGWKGGATAGLSITQATQNNRSVNGNLALIRAVPDVSWLALRSRTLFNLNEAYGTLEQPNTPLVKTSLFHTDIEQDYYLSPRAFFFGNAALDHNFSQGLQLQQTYGAGFGAAVIKSALQEFDVRASVDYINQEFINQQLLGNAVAVPSTDQHLIGSVFGETYLRHLPWKILLNESASVTPAWNNSNAYSAVGIVNFTFPVYHHFGFQIGAVDNYLNDPSPGFRKNSLQTTVGARYAFE